MILSMLMMSWLLNTLPEAVNKRCTPKQNSVKQSQMLGQKTVRKISNYKQMRNTLC